MAAACALVPRLNAITFSGAAGEEQAVGGVEGVQQRRRMGFGGGDHRGRIAAVAQAGAEARVLQGRES